MHAGGDDRSPLAGLSGSLKKSRTLRFLAEIVELVRIAGDFSVPILVL